MKLVLIANSSGGVAKTTTAHACAVAATEYGKKVLLIDADPTAALTFICGVENPRITTKEFLNNEFSLESALVRTSERFSLLPASSRLANLEAEKLLSGDIFKQKLADFELVIVDSASGFSLLTQYFAALADLVIYPANLEILGIRGALHAKEFVTNSQYMNHHLILLTKQDTAPSQEILQQIGEDFEYLEPSIRFDKLIPDSQSTGKSFLATANQSAVSADYREITYTILEKLELI